MITANFPCLQSDLDADKPPHMYNEILLNKHFDLRNTSKVLIKSIAFKKQLGYIRNSFSWCKYVSCTVKVVFMAICLTLIDQNYIILVST